MTSPTTRPRRTNHNDVRLTPRRGPNGLQRDPEHDGPRRYQQVNTGKYKTQSVADYYAGKKVFVTGGTGFLGKVLIERLLTCCTQIDSIYVLIREKEGQTIEARLKQLLDVPLFDKLKRGKPESLSKVIPIPGDIAKDKLAIAQEDENALIEDVSVVFHSAATVKFTEPFKTMIKVNLEGTAKIMDLSKRMKNLDTFVYISTAFSNSNKPVIDEVIYPPPKPLDEVYKFIEKHGDNQEEIDKFLVGLPNTYTFSKALCETLVQQDHGHMKTIIVRPSIVTPALQSSLPGWCDSWVAATATFSDVARGLTRVIYGERDVACNMIPVDYVCNLAIVAAATGNPCNEVAVYNSCSTTDNSISWKQGADLYLEESLTHGRVPGALKPRKVAVSTSPLVVSYLTLTRQTIPALFADLWLRIKGKKPRHMKMQKRAVLLRDLLRGFTSTKWVIKSDKAQQLMATMSEEDRVLFPCDPKIINWKEYMKTFYSGVQKFMLNKQ
ncbi:putative fatty acyl-CoA reductase CG5065 isoform X1 [Maniola hyperantus]|uniref:putative fatty acyl-CoA reductase CG5065 isoform X1 n=1 Tax=Aphantopus hyperantus TaxID=2795564 RepID=UPI001568BD01|nr:putative fatty acyl-CoA reductase CG5065 [Maniola hyperantus]